MPQFLHTLNSQIRLDDESWNYQVPNLPSPQTLNKTNQIKAIVIKTDTKQHLHSITLKINPVDSNRAIDVDAIDKFLSVSLSDFKPLVRSSTEENDAATRFQPETPREVSDYSVRFLRTGITLQGIHYHFYGHSNSQLKSRSCVLFAGTKDEISTKIEALGDFSRIKTVAKKSKRIGLLFSSAKTALTISPQRCEDIADVEGDDYIFTDGCGLVAPKLAQELARRVRIVFRGSRYTPSVFQIRYRGYKGVVTVDPRMRSKEDKLLMLRKSMKKFSGGDSLAFCVVDYSKPFAYGFLNDETILLLHALGVSEAILSQKQDEHFKLLQDATVDFRSAFCFLAYINRPDLAEQVFLNGIDTLQPTIQRLINAECNKTLNKRDNQKCRILIPKSRLLFGVCDAWDVLKEGECAVRVTMEGNGQPYTLMNTEVSVIRNPCLHPGDWQKFRAVQRVELAHLVDCVVFSTRGRRPAADLMSGGDLDGDQFFVCWDSDLIPSTVSQPALYPGGREPMLFRPITDDDRLVYFAKYTNASLGRVKALYLNWARACGPMSPQCQELNRLFSQCVDGNRIKIPQKLEVAPLPPADSPKFILDVLHEGAMSWIKTLTIKSARPNQLDGFDADALQLLLNRDDISMSEFEFILLAHNWCFNNQVPFGDLLYIFDFTTLKPEQQAWVINQLPPSQTAPALILNALCSSNILSDVDLNHFQMGSPLIRWKRVYDAPKQDRLDTFLEAVAFNIESFHRKLIIFRPDDRLCLAIYIPRKVERHEDCLIEDSGRMFAFPTTQGPERQSRLALPTKKMYQVYCDGNVFQLFDGKRANSWVFMTRPGVNDEAYRNTKNQGDRRRERQGVIDKELQSEVCVSVALDKFSRGLQRHIGRVNRAAICAAEIYIISNRDTRSMRNLDLWLEYVETQETMPLFSREPKEFAVPRLDDLVLDSCFSHLLEIIKSQDLSMLETLEFAHDYQNLFDLAQRIEAKTFLLQCFEYILERSSYFRLDFIDLFHLMVTQLRQLPSLAVILGKWLTRQDNNEQYSTLFEIALVPILQAFILSASSMDNLIVAPLKCLLIKAPSGSLSISSLSTIMELIALTVRSTELAFDILVGCLEPQCERLVGGEPLVAYYLFRQMAAIVMDHIDEVTQAGKSRPDLLELSSCDKKEIDGYSIVEISFRIDAPGGTPKLSSHVRFTTASRPTNQPLAAAYSVDAIVTLSEAGRARFKCFRPLPVYFQQCSWTMEDLGPFTTTKTMMEAVSNLCLQQESACGVSSYILGTEAAQIPLPEASRFAWEPIKRLNKSQNAAVRAALSNSLVCLQGPPGTGKTETIVEMICALQETYHTARFLIAAPTHNAVDNVMRRYLKRLQEQSITSRPNVPTPLRVSTEVRKVAEDLRRHTCDGMAGQEIYSNRKAMDQAKQAIKRSDIIFSTCIGAGIGLLRTQDFDFVIVDEASQQTEPASLVPLVKGCCKAVLVGDHVQLRPTVGQSALALEFDVSLFERLFTRANRGQVVGEDETERLMLDVQYRMHPSICTFSSDEFYDGKLKTGIALDARPIDGSMFPFPKGTKGVDFERALFIQCSSREMPGQKSKENKGQAEICLQVCKLLTAASNDHGIIINSSPTTKSTPEQSIAILTPYTRQADLLKRSLAEFGSRVEVSSIDGFQGREADIVVFVTVRCNEHCETGFLKDLRRMNVALTRARAALIVIGDRNTLTKGTSEGEGNSVVVWTKLVRWLKEVELPQENTS